MCGRFTLKTPLGKWLFDLFCEQLSGDLPILEPRYNIAPTQQILIALRPSKKELLQLESVRWGLIPSWAKEIQSSAPLINARSETLSEKPTFRTAFRQSRCAVIADGYYEWQILDKKRKQPFWVHRPDESPFLMAGLTSTNKHLDSARALKSATIVTTSSNDRLSMFHDRMPVILNSQDKLQRWLSCEPIDEEHTVSDLTPVPDDFFQARPVSSWVGNPRHEDSRCLQAAPALSQRTLGIDELVEPDT